MNKNYKRVKRSRYSVEHRFVMEKYIGRELTKTEVVHHKNGNKMDNRIKNLLLLPSRAEHNRLHAGSKCPQGHKMIGHNLVIRKNGARRCRKCHNATAHIYKNNPSIANK